MADYDVDVLIIGGGHMGVCLLLALTNLGFSVRLVEKKSFSTDIIEDFDARSLALSPASVQILKKLSVWPVLEKTATPINTIHVSQKNYFGSTRLHADLEEPLGYVVEMQYLNQALQQSLDLTSVITQAQLIALDEKNGLATIAQATGETTIQAKIIVAADGTHSVARTLCGLQAVVKQYSQEAIVTNIGLARSHNHVAYERFTDTGPMALLPLNGLRASLVWTQPSQRIQNWRDMPDGEFLAHLQKAFGYRLGRLLRVGQRASYPLIQVLMPQQVCGKVVFVGNAAHTLHPVAGQGFNLGLRDIAMLAQVLLQHGLTPDALHLYEQSRAHDQKRIQQLTDGLIELFLSKFPGLGWARAAGLMLMDHSVMLQKAFTRYARGYGGINPDLACGIDLLNKERDDTTI